MARSSTTPPTRSTACAPRRRAKSPGVASCCCPTSEPDLAGVRAVLETARDLGFLGPGPAEGQLDHARAFVDHLPPVGPCVDLGSGGGVPGLVAASLLPGTSWVLVDSMRKRTDFLRRSVDALGLGDRVTVHLGRAEEVPSQQREAAAAVTARGFGPPAVTAECAAGWLAPGGVLVVSEPPGGDAARWDDDGLRALGLASPLVLVGPPALAVLRKIGPTPAHLPRSVGQPGKRPLW